MTEGDVRRVLPSLNPGVYTLTVTCRYPAGAPYGRTGRAFIPLNSCAPYPKGRSRWGGESGTGAFPQ